LIFDKNYIYFLSDMHLAMGRD